MSTVFDFLSRYFWLICLAISGYQYFAVGRRAKIAGSQDQHEHAALSYRRWFVAASALPWLVMGAGQLSGSTPTVWYYFRPQDLNPFVLAFVASVFLLSVGLMHWVFFHDGARKVVQFRLMETYGFSGPAPLTERQVKLFAGVGPPFVVLWVATCIFMDAPVPK